MWRIIIITYYLDKCWYMTRLIVTTVSADIFDFASDSARNRPVTYTRQEWDALYVVFEMFQLFREYNNRAGTVWKLTIEKVGQIKITRSAPPPIWKRYWNFIHHATIPIYFPRIYKIPFWKIFSRVSLRNIRFLSVRLSVSSIKCFLFRRDVCEWYMYQMDTRMSGTWIQ